MSMERKYLGHFIDTSMGGTTASYYRIGKDLEEYNEELNPQVEVKRNILGEQNTHHQGYEAQSAVEPFYAEEDDPLYEALENIVLKRLQGADCMTTKIDVLLSSTGTVVWAWKEDVMLVPTAHGGDTSGYQIPFTIYNCGNREEVTSRVTISNGVLSLSAQSGGGSGGSGG